MDRAAPPASIAVVEEHARDAIGDDERADVEVLADDRGSRGLRARWSDIVLLLACAAVAGFTVYTFTGYLYGYADHTLLMIKGLSWADSSAFRGDWFNERAPQPHWLFDVVTFVGERAGRLPEVYFAYWIATLLVFGLGAVYLAGHWLPTNRWPLAVGAVLITAAGPKFVFGQFLPLEGQALPNLLGGSLAFATVAAVVARRERAAMVLAVATGVVHVQHGTVVACVLLAAAVLSRSPRRMRLSFVGVAMGLFVLTFVVSTARGLTADNSDMLEICTLASPGHCDANSWPWAVVRDGLLIVGMSAAVALLRPRDWRTLVPVVVLPAIAVAAGFYADRWDLGALGELSQRAFPYRVNSMLTPFAPWTIVLLAAGRERYVWRALIRFVLAGALGAIYLASTYSITGNAVIEFRNLRLLGFAVGALLATPMIVEALASTVSVRRLARLAALPLAAALAVTLAGGAILQKGFADLHPGRLHLGLRPDDGQAAFGQEIETTLPAGAIIAHSPELEWVRLLTRRAVVGNCKAIPYGGEPWTEYKERMAALGAPGPYGACERAGFEALTLADVVDLRRRFDATHVLLLSDDPKIDAARAARWTLVWDSGATESWWVFEIPAAAPDTATTRR